MRNYRHARRGFAVAAASAAIALMTCTPSLADYSIVAVDPKRAEVGVAIAGCDNTEIAHAPVLVPVAGAAVSGVERSQKINAAFLTGLQSGALPQTLLDDVAKQTTESEESLAVATWRYGSAVLTKTTSAHFSPTAQILRGSVSIQGNNLASDSVLPAAKSAFKSTTGDLASKLLAALEAAEAAGGDAACSKQATAAALLVASPGDSLYNAYEWFTPSSDPKNVLDLKSKDLPSVFISALTKPDAKTPAVGKLRGLADSADFKSAVRLRSNAYLDGASLNRFIAVAFGGAAFAAVMLVMVIRRNRRIAAAGGADAQGNQRSGNPAKR